MGVSHGLRLGVLASGRGSNLEAICAAIEGGRLPARVSLVLSDRKDAPALECARGHGAPAVFVDPKAHADREAYERALLDALAAEAVDLVCLAGFLRVLGGTFVDALQGRLMNIHPSLLPAFPGLHAQRRALEHGVKLTGATVHFVDTGVDTGPIIVQDAVPVLAHDTEASLSARILTVEHRLYPEAIGLFAAGRLRVEGRRVVIVPPRSARG